MTQTSTNLKFDRVESLAEILAILDESQGIRERLEDMDKRLQRVLPFASVESSILALRNLEDIMGNIVDNDLAATAAKLTQK